MTDGNGGGLAARLARINPTAAFMVTLVVVLAGMFLPGIVGGALLLVLAGALATLTMTTWPVQPPATRVVRLLMLTLLVVAALAKVL